jgi:hypothetical protein
LGRNSIYENATAAHTETLFRQVRQSISGLSCLRLRKDSQTLLEYNSASE